MMGAIPEWVVPPRCQDLAIPLAPYCTLPVEGSRPLKMISFRWSHIAHSVASIANMIVEPCLPNCFPCALGNLLSSSHPNQEKPGENDDHSDDQSGESSPVKGKFGLPRTCES